MLETYQIIGYSGGVPTQERGVSSVMVSTSNFDIMIDCGEGSYLRWQKTGYKWKNLKYIFITHMHPDHTAGLVPLLFYRKLFSIETILTIIGPPQLKAFIADSFQHTGINNIQDIRWIDISTNNEMNLPDSIHIKAMEMQHKIPCWGYRIEDDSKSIVFITDTVASSNAVALAQKSDILIHEATFNHEMHKKAAEHFHTTNVQAMEIADKALVKRLVLTHFSPKLSDGDIQDWIWNGKPCVIFDERQEI
jgi:ribonuclease Z